MYGDLKTITLRSGSLICEMLPTHLYLYIWPSYWDCTSMLVYKWHHLTPFFFISAFIIIIFRGSPWTCLPTNETLQEISFHFKHLSLAILKTHPQEFPSISWKMKELLQTVRTPALQLHLKFSSYTKPTLWVMNFIVSQAHLEPDKETMVSLDPMDPMFSLILWWILLTFPIKN